MAGPRPASVGGPDGPDIPPQGVGAIVVCRPALVDLRVMDDNTADRRREPRGEFPVHSDLPRPILTLAQARRMARDRLDEWRRNHGQ